MRGVLVRFTQSARRHRIGKARALHVINHTEPTVVAADEDLQERLLWIGPVPPEDAMSPKHVAGPDIDLDREVVRDRKGRRITERRAREIASETLERAGVGRPSLTAPGKRSPEVKARVPEELRDRLHEAASREHTSSSELIRKALERYLAS